MPKKITLAAETFDVPLGKLVLSPQNVRKTYDPAEIETLAASIRTPGRGLLQNLGVAEQLGEGGEPTGLWEVVAGGRRWRALKLLAERKQLAANAPIPCRKVAREDATDASLAENEHRQALHPADAYEAYAALHRNGEGHGVEEIAARHGVSAHVVRQRLRLGTVAPALLDAYRAGLLTLDQVMAFAVTEDQAAQVRVFNELAAWQRTPAAIRRVLTEAHVPATDRRAVLVGLDAYQAAGGRVQRDLFSEDGGGWLTDPPLLERLVGERMRQAAEQVAAEGWKWIAADPEAVAACWRLRQVYPGRVGLSEEDEKRREGLAARWDEMVAERPCGFEDAPKEVRAEVEAIEAELDALDAKEHAYDPEDVARAGATVSLAQDGTLRIERGFVRPEDEPRPDPVPEPAEEADPGDGEEGDEDDEDDAAAPGAARFGAFARPAHAEAVKVPVLPAAVENELEAHRTLGLRAVIARQPVLALRVAVHSLATATFYGHYGNVVASFGGAYGAMVSHGVHHGLADSPARQAVARAEAEQRERLPKQQADLWAWTEAQDVPALLALLAVCVARLSSAGRGEWTTEVDARATAARVAGAAGLDMREWWTATRESYFDRVPKALIVEAVREGGGAEAARRIENMTKEGMAENATAALAGKGWLPRLLRVPRPDAPEPDAQGSEPDTGPMPELDPGLAVEPELAAAE